MGITDFRPFFRVTVDGEDLSSTLAPRLSSLSLSDGAGVQSDTVQITLTDTGLFRRLQEPGQGAEIRVWLGYAFNLTFMGEFVADSIEVSGPPDRMVITGVTSINGETSSGKAPLTTQKTRSWASGTKVDDLVATIAREHGLEHKVSDSLKEIVLPHIDQIDESDMHLLSRVSRDIDAIAKPGNGFLIMVARGESTTASGEPMPRILVVPKAVSSWRYRNSLREKAGRIVASYQDVRKAKTVEVEAGSGEPVYRVKRRFPDAASALRAAGNEMKRLQRAGRTLSITMPGNADAIAEARMSVSGFRTYVDGEWLIISANHVLDSGGYRTSVSAEQL